MKRNQSIFARFLALLICAAAGFLGRAEAQELSFELTLKHVSSANEVDIVLKNTSRSDDIGYFELSIGDRDFNYDAVGYNGGFRVVNRSGPPIGIAVVDPDFDFGGDKRSSAIVLRLSGFDPEDQITFRTDIDNNNTDWREILFNNGTKDNAIATVAPSVDSETRTTLTLPDGPVGMTEFFFQGGPIRRWITVRSLVETVNVGTSNFEVAQVDVESPDFSADYSRIADLAFRAYDDETIIISAPAVVYYDINQKELARSDTTVVNSAEIEEGQILEEAEERFIASGISVNDVPQTGDPTRFQFDVDGDTDIVVKWHHDFALRVDHDFSNTGSTGTRPDGTPWVEELDEPSTGDPLPASGKHWLRKGEALNASIDGQVIDLFSFPGLPLRFVPTHVRAYGPPNPATSRANDEDRRLSASDPVDIRIDPDSIGTTPFNIGPFIPERRELDQFLMYGPGGITFVWQIQYGVEVSMDDPARDALPKVLEGTTPSNLVEGGRSGVGTFWFNPGASVYVATPTQVDTADSNSAALIGWGSGDGYYFPVQGALDTQTGELKTPLIDQGSPRDENGNPVAEWDPEFDFNNRPFRGLKIPALDRPARVQWLYGSQAFGTTVVLGEHVFQDDPATAEMFPNPPESFTLDFVDSAAGANYQAEAMAVWDPAARRLYPVIPGRFRAQWRPVGADEPVEVVVEVVKPDQAHYPHIVGTPPVPLDPNPDDDFIFKELRYLEGEAAIDSDTRFVCDTPGWSVLLFAQIQPDGRGNPREFLQVRTVESKEWDAESEITKPATIGTKITDSDFDLARLGTGYVLPVDSGRAKRGPYNPFIYDEEILGELSVNTIYDPVRLAENPPVKILLPEANLPGPVIPVNVQNSDTARLVVVWYDDPVVNDRLLWPHRAVIYNPSWPEDKIQAQALSSVFDGDGVYTRLNGSSATSLALSEELVLVAAENALTLVDMSDPEQPVKVGEWVDGMEGFTRFSNPKAVVAEEDLVVVAAEDALNLLRVGGPEGVELLSILVDGQLGFNHLGGASAIALQENLLAVAAEDAVSFIDVTDPEEPLLHSVVEDGDPGFGLLQGPTALTLGGSFAWVAAENAVTLIDVANPASPHFLSSIQDGQGGFQNLAAATSVKLGNVLGLVTGEDSLTVVGLQDPANPLLLAELAHGATSSTRLDGASSLDLMGELAVIAAEDSHAITVVNLQDPTNPVAEASLYDEGQRTFLQVAGKPRVSLTSTDPNGPGRLFSRLMGARHVMLRGNTAMVYSAGDSSLTAIELMPERLGNIVIASQFGSEGVDATGADQEVVPAIGNFDRQTTYNPSRLQAAQVYVQDSKDLPGYNPNEEHALMAPSLRFAEVSPRPPAAYALRDGDLNITSGADYTSEPFVLVQFFDVAENEFKMNVYRVQKESLLIPGYRFASPSRLVAGSTPAQLVREPHIVMEAGEPVIPFYPLGVAIGASPCPETFGNNFLGLQTTYWEDHKGTYWSVSGGENAWFESSFYYPLNPGFWWPDGINVSQSVEVPPIRIVESGENATIRAEFNDDRTAFVPRLGDCVAFLPANVHGAATANNLAAHLPTRVLYKSDWPAIAPVLKSGETLTFQGGEFRSDHATMQIVDEDGELKTVETPGLPGIVGFASAEVVFDQLNPQDLPNTWTTDNGWTARVAQVLETRKVPFQVDFFPSELQPANGRTRVSQGKYIFNDLSASLQRRVRFNPLSVFQTEVQTAGGGTPGDTSDDEFVTINTTGALEIKGLLNDKDIGEPTLTAAPPAVYILEPNILTQDDVDELKSLDSETDSKWDDAVDRLFQETQNPNGLQISSSNPFLVGLEGAVIFDGAEPRLEPVEEGSEVLQVARDETEPAPLRGFGPGLALIPNQGFLDPSAGLPDVSWVTVAENNDPSLGGSPITLHVIKVDRRERYRGAIKTVLSDNVFDENLGLRHTGDFGAHADDLYFEWWYRPDDGSLNVPPPDLLEPGQPNPWKLFPDPTGNQGRGRYEITLKGNPNAPEALLADTWWFVRYRHDQDAPQPPPDWDTINFTWAGAGNSDPFNDFDFDGVPDYRAQLAQGWIKRVLDAVNPYEARIRNFEEDSPSTRSSMISQFGPRFEGPVALNPDKNVIENVGLIELYETIFKRGRDLSIDLSRPVATPAIFNALQLVSTRIADFYTILGNEAYTDAIDPTIGFGSSSVEYGSLAPAVFSFQNQMSSLIEEELGLLRGADDFFARPVYNRLFWNFTKGEGEAAYALNYNINDVNADGFVDEDDAMILYPQGHGDAWGHYLKALRVQYQLLNHPFFNWVSRSEFYNLQDIVIKVDFLDERKFAQTAAAKAKSGAEIVDLTYREKYVEDPNAQWQGYTDSNKDRSWGVQGWARRTAQAAYFDWVTANALLPAEHPNEELEGIQKVDRTTNSDISVISAHLNAIQRTFDEANNGVNPLGLAGNVVPFDINPGRLARIAFDGTTHFEQIYDRAVQALQNAVAVWDNANQTRNMLRKIGNTEEAFRNSVFQEDNSFKNRLIEIFGKPYEGTIGSGQLYPPGYDGPDLALFMYVDVREINDETVPGPTASFASFDENGNLIDGEIHDAWNDGLGGTSISTLNNGWRELFSPTFFLDTDDEGNRTAPFQVRDGWYSVAYTDLINPKVPLDNFSQLMPVTAKGYTFQAPKVWGGRLATGKLQVLINQMIQQEAQVAKAIADWDALAGEIGRTFRIINARIKTKSDIRTRNQAFQYTRYAFDSAIAAIDATLDFIEGGKEILDISVNAVIEGVPKTLPTAGLAVSPGDALSPLRFGAGITQVSTTTVESIQQRIWKAFKVAEQIAFNGAEIGVNFLNAKDETDMEKREWLKELEDLVGDEPIKRVEVFRQIEALRALSDQYRSLVDEGSRLLDSRMAFNKRVAAQTQRNRYQDMTFRVSRNHALENYRAAFDLAAQYAYLAAKAYDYETNLDPDDPGSPSDIYNEIVRARTLGHFSSGQPRLTKGGLSEPLARLKANYQVLSSQLGFNNPQEETEKISLRTELFRILPKGSTQPSEEEDPSGLFESPGADSNTLWRETLLNAQVDDLWQVPEFRYYCRPFAPETTADGTHVEQPGLVLRFGTQIRAGENFFGRPLTGADHAYDPSNFATKIRSVGVWFSDYRGDNVLSDLSETPRVYLVPIGVDVMRIPNSIDNSYLRIWNVLDQSIPVPFPAPSSELEQANYIPLLDSLNGRMGEPRRFSSFRAYHNGSETVNDDQLVFDSRLVGRSIWNSQWILIVPGISLNADAEAGLEEFINQVSDIKIIFNTYGISGG